MLLERDRLFESLEVMPQLMLVCLPLLLILMIMAAGLLPDNSYNISMHPTLIDSLQTNFAPVSSSNNNPNPYCNPFEISMIIMNCQSIVPKKVEVGCIVDSVKPDVLIATETWLSTSISSSEFFPLGYNVYQKDRQDGYGGVLLPQKSIYSSHQLALDTNCEIIACQLEVPNNPSFDHICCL